MSTIRATYVQHGSSAVPNITLNASGQVIVASGIVSSGTFAAPTGSAAAPGVYFVGDTNTGLYSPGADQVAISTNGTGRLFVDASGRVGVGTASPSNKLHVVGGNAANVLVDNDGSQFTQLLLQRNGTANTGGDLLVDGTAGKFAIRSLVGPLCFETSSPAGTNSERLRITSAGLVGIGTSAPSADLYVKQSGTDISAASQTVAVFQRSSTTGHSAKISIIAGNAATSDIHFGDTDDEDAGILQYNHTNNNFNFNQALGIGTTTVSSNLHIKPTTGDDSVFTNGLRVERNDTSGQYGLFNYAGGAASITAVETTASNPVVRFLRSTNGSTTTETARFDASGRLLVGTSTTVSIGGSSGFIQQHGNKTTCNMALAGYANSLGGPILAFGSSRSTTVGTAGVIVNSGDILGDIRFAGDDGTDINTTAAAIRGEVDGTPGANDMPGRLVFSTTADGASSPTERMRINAGGNFLINQTTTDDPAGTNTQGLAFGSAGWISNCRDGATPVLIGRKVATLVNFFKMALLTCGTTVATT
jgi:hypothetical protein